MPSAKTPTEWPREGALLEFGGFHIRLAQLYTYADFMRDQPEPAMTPGQFAMLILINENPGTTQRALSERIGIDKSTLAVALNRLAERKLVRRVRSKQDRRSNVLELSASGKAQMKRMVTFVRKHERRMLKNLSGAEQRELVRLLDKMIGID